jgi:hypothetical protein
MQAWEQEWFPNATPTASPPMSQSEMGMTMDVNTLKTAQPFDKAFMEAISPIIRGRFIFLSRCCKPPSGGRSRS